MTNQGPEPQAKTAFCVWCTAEYLQSASRARTSSLFCCTKCEVEARFWLVSRLESSIAPDETAGV
jgi:hypothetical protein